MTKQQLWEKAKMLPLLPGVYIIRDKEGQIIYIGKAKRLRTRVSQYFREGVPHDAKVTKMISHAFEFDVIVTQSEFEALVLECSQIKQHKPKYNILLKDDKGYSYVKVTREKWPRLSAALQKDDENADYYGPFTSSFAVREMVEAASDVFRLPRCTRRFPQDIGKGRPCLNAHIGKCMAVCSGKIRNEDYREAVESALHMIRHGQADIMKTLKARMEDAAERLDFERAALIRDQLAAIEKVSRGQKVVRSEVAEQDVIAFAGSGQLGLEALSRGAASCVFLDESRAACAVVRENAAAARLAAKARVLQTSAGAYLAACSDTFHLVLLDPPYHHGTVAAILPAVAQVLAPGGVVLAETERGAQLPEACGALRLARQYRYGTVLVSKYTLCAGGGQ